MFYTWLRYQEPMTQDLLKAHNLSRDPSLYHFNRHHKGFTRDCDPKNHWPKTWHMFTHFNAGFNRITNVTIKKAINNKTFSLQLTYEHGGVKVKPPPWCHMYVGRYRDTIKHLARGRCPGGTHIGKGYGDVPWSWPPFCRPVAAT